jgi:septal ring factor EnvC (AmiA/AmiB activator)
MRMPGAILGVFTVLVSSPVLNAGPQDEIGKRQAELESIRNEIRLSETRISEVSKNEKATLELLDAYDRKTTLLRRLIAGIRREEQQLQLQIDSIKAEMDLLESRLRALKDHYAGYVASVYKAGSVNDIELLLTAQSVNQAFVRSEYLSRFVEQRKIDARNIREKKAEIEALQFSLAGSLTEQRRLLAEKGAEESRLASLTTDRQDVLKKIRKDKKSLQKEIERKRKAARDLEAAIADLVEAERLRKEQAGGALPQPPPIEGGFKARKGKLRWPVGQGSVVAKFGNQTHPTLKTVTENPGIDIAVKPGTPVVAVANARVARIWWLVSYGNLVILDHGDGYRTIYAHLSDISVTEGQSIEEGTTIATSGETLDGSRLHFEIWKDREKQNPEQWLARR